MAIEYIIDAVAFLKQEYGDISPMALAHSKGILVDAQHYGNIQESFRGFAIQLHGKLHVTLNLDQDEVMQQVCLAHAGKQNRDIRLSMRREWIFSYSSIMYRTTIPV